MKHTENKSLDGLVISEDDFHKELRERIFDNGAIVKKCKKNGWKLDRNSFITKKVSQYKSENVKYEFHLPSVQELKKLSKMNFKEFKEYLMNFSDTAALYILPEFVSPVIRKFSDGYFEAINRYASKRKRKEKKLFQIRRNLSGYFIKKGSDYYKLNSIDMVEGPDFICTDGGGVMFYGEPEILQAAPIGANAYKTSKIWPENIENHEVESAIILGDIRKTRIEHGSYHIAHIAFYNIDIDESKKYGVHDYYLVDKHLMDKKEAIEKQISQAINRE